MKVTHYLENDARRHELLYSCNMTKKCLVILILVYEKFCSACTVHPRDLLYKFQKEFAFTYVSSLSVLNNHINSGFLSPITVCDQQTRRLDIIDNENIFFSFNVKKYSRSTK